MSPTDALTPPPIGETDIRINPDLAPEQLERAGEIAVAMMDKFGIDPGDIGVIKDPIYDRHVVIYTGQEGLYRGSWNQVLEDNTGQFMIEVDGEEVDTRDGMTRSVYNAWIEYEKARGTEPLPDKENNRQTATLLTGASNGFSAARIGIVRSNDRPDDVSVPKSHDSEYMRFRPAVVI